MDSSPIQQILNQTKQNILKNTEKLQQYLKQQKQVEDGTSIKTILEFICNQDQGSLMSIQVIQKNKDIAKFAGEILFKMKTPSTAPTQKIQQQPKKKSEKKKQQPKEKPVRSNSLLRGVLSKIMNTEPQGVQMKLPDKQPKCVYDPIKKMYIIQGQQQQQVKEIPKPPPNKKNNSLTSNISVKSASKKSEVDQMTAPPVYNRKGAKNKVKGGPGQKRQSGSNMNFQSFIERVNVEFAKLFQSFESYNSQIPKAIQPVRDQQLEKSLLSKLEEYNMIWSSMNVFSQEIHTQIEKDLQFFQHQSEKSSIKAMLRQINQSSSIYKQALDKITQLNDLGRLKKKKRPSNDSAIAAQQHKRIDNQYKELKKHYENLHVQRNQKENEFSRVYGQLEEQKRNSEQKLMKAINQRQDLLRNVQQITEQNEELQQDYNVLQSQIKKMASYLGINVSQIIDSNSQVPEEVVALQKIRLHILNMKEELKILKQSINARNLQFEGFNQEKEVLMKTIKLQQRLIEQLRQNEDLSEEFSQASSSQSQLLHKVTKARLTINSEINNSVNDYRNTADMSRNKTILATSSNLESFLQLSNASSSITRSYIQNIKSLRSLAQMWEDKYHNLKQNMEKNRQHLGSQQASLNRTVNKLKNLVETYKISQEQAENRASNLQLQCQKLRKQVVHLRHQQSFSKQMLEQSMRNSQSHQGELQSIQLELQNTIKKYNQLKAENGEKDQIIDSMDKEIEQLQKQHKKISNTVKEQQRRFNIESEGTIENKKQLQQSLKEWKVKYEELLVENQQLVSHYQSENKNLQQALSKKDRQMKEELRKITKVTECSANQLREISQQLEQSKKREQAIYDQLNKERRINNQIQEAINEMSQKHNKIKLQWRKEQQHTQEKINYLLQELQSSSQKSQQLMVNIAEYRGYIENLMKEYEVTKKAEKQDKAQTEALLAAMQEEIKGKDQSIFILNQQIQQVRRADQSKYQVKMLQEKLNAYQCQIRLLQSKQENQQALMRTQIQQKQYELGETLQILQQKQNQLTILNSQLEQLNTKIKVFEAKNQDIQSNQPNAQSNKIQELQEMIRQLRSSLQLNCKQREQQRLVSNKNAEELSQLLSALQEENQKIQQRNKQLELQNTNYRQQLKVLRQKIVQQSKEEHEQQMNTLLATIVQLQGKLQKNDQQMQKLIQKGKSEGYRSKEAEQIQELLIKQEQTLQSLNQENETSKQNLQELEGKYRKLQKQFSQQKQELADAELRVSEVSMKLKMAEQSGWGKSLNNSDKQVNQAESVNKHLAQKESQIKQMLQKIEELNTSIKRLKNNHQLEVSTLKETNNHLTEKQLLAEDKITQLEKQINKVNSYKKKIKQLSAQVTQLQAENSQLLQQKTELLRANQKLSEKISNFRSIEVLATSTNNNAANNFQSKNQNSKIKDAPKTVFDESKKQNIPSQTKKTQNNELKSQIRSDVKPKPKGGLFASLFLTPSEVQRMQTQ